MIGCQRKPIACLLMLLVFLSACSALSPEPTATPIPEPTDTPTPIPPTPTPSPADMLAAGWQAYDTADLDTAREIAEQVLEQFPEDGEAYALLGAVEGAEGEITASIEHLEIALERGINDPTKRLLSMAYVTRAAQIPEEIYSTWDYDQIRDLIYEARDFLERYQELGIGGDSIAEQLDAWFSRPVEELPETLNEDSPAFPYWQAAAGYEQAGNLNAAIAEMETAIEIDPESAFLYSYMVELYVMQEDYASALEYLQTALEANPNLYQLRSDLGFLYSFQFLPLHAREAFVTSMLANPENERSEEGLYVLGLTFGPWDDTRFLDYGFRFALDPEGEYREMPDRVVNSPQEGISTYVSPATMLNLIWMPVKEYAYGENFNPVEVVSHIPEDLSLLGEVTSIGDPLVFKYNQIPITYQPYIFSFGGMEDATSIAIYAVWQCDSIVFILNQMISQDDPTYLFMINPGLESITCSPEPIIPEHPLSQIQSNNNEQ